MESAKGIIISGGPRSVYEPGAPMVDRAIFALPSATLGICYGQQLMAYLLGGQVQRGEKGEYGMAILDIDAPSHLLAEVHGNSQVWMSHRDTVKAVPPGFTALAHTSTCAIASMEDAARKLYAVQFHPEVAHTRPGKQILRNFLFNICGCHQDWDPSRRIPAVEEHIQKTAAGRKVFFFVSGGVDSTVAYTLCLQALGPNSVHGAYVDTGLMREHETEFVRENFARLGAKNFQIVDARNEFLAPLTGITDPEETPHHRLVVRRRAGAHPPIRPLHRRRLDPRPGHHLSRHHRVRRNNQVRQNQDPSQPCLGHSEVDRRRPHH